MKSLLIGNGAREHAIAEQMAKNSELYVFASANNPGISALAKGYWQGNILDPEAVLKYAMHIQPDYVFIGPEAPLALGVSDLLMHNGIKVAGPTSVAARLESDKSFCRTLMEEYVPHGHPKFAICSTAREVTEALKDFTTDIVVKPAGLTGGKGVQVQGIHLKDLSEVREYATKVVTEEIGGSSVVVLEEKLEGEEFTLQVFTDGYKVIPMPIVQDHKLLLEGDTGPMTGGMGSYTDANHLLPFLNQEDVDSALNIIKQTIEGLKKKTGLEYKGVLYGQFMLTKTGPKIIEYNVRFGDPEAMNVLPILKSDFSDLCLGLINGALPNVEFENKATVCKYLVPKGYPDKEKIGKPTKILVDEQAVEAEGAKLFYASVDARENGIYTSTSRALGIVGIADTINEAEMLSERAIHKVPSDALFYRKDIGKAELIQKRIDHMKELR